MLQYIKLNRLHRYVLKQIFQPFISGVAVFVFMMMSLQFFVLSEMILVHDFNMNFILKILGLVIVKLLPIVMPISFLFSVLMAISKMSSDSELIAMRAVGLSLYSILKPILYLGFVISLIVMWCNIDLVPRANRTLKNLVIKASSTKAISQLQPESFTSGFFDLVVFAHEVNSKQSTFSKVFIYDSRTKNKYAIVGDSGQTISVDSDNPFESNLILQINDGSILFNDTKQSQIIHFDRYQINLEIDESSAEAAVKPNYLTFKELRAKIKDPPNEKERILFLLEFHTRFSIGVGCLVFAFLGLAFGISPPRGQQKSSVLISIIVLVGYYLFFLLGGQLAEKGFAPPGLIIWLPNVFTLLIGVYKLNSYKRSFY